MEDNCPRSCEGTRSDEVPAKPCGHPSCSGLAGRANSAATAAAHAPREEESWAANPTMTLRREHMWTSTTGCAELMGPMRAQKMKRGDGPPNPPASPRRRTRTRRGPRSPPGNDCNRWAGRSRRGGWGAAGAPGSGWGTACAKCFAPRTGRRSRCSPSTGRPPRCVPGARRK